MSTSIDQVRERLRQRTEHFRTRLSHAEALPQLAILGILAGIATCLVVHAFRLAIQLSGWLWMPEGDAERFESLPGLVRFLLPIGGALLIALILARAGANRRSGGVAYVIERVNHHQGQLPLGNAVLQFVVTVIAILTGQSVGREGPAVHLGATASSLTGQWLRLPNNSLRVLVGCGTAAAISASFNTPMAGVIFAMEVVLMEYTVTQFTPVILAAVIGALSTQILYGSKPAFEVPAIEMQSLWELPFVAFEGLWVGAIAALFIVIHRRFLNTGAISIQRRLMAAGVLTGTVGLVIPEVLGIGYDTVDHALVGQIGVGVLCAFVLGKLVVTAITTGLGMPGGVIGPSLVIGAGVGGIVGELVAFIAPNNSSSAGFYVIVGMGAMMGALLHAPLAALVALLELTNNPGIILPSMLAIIVALLSCRALFRQQSVFDVMLEARGSGHSIDPLARVLRHAGVASIMDRSFARASRLVEVQDAKRLLAQEPRWILIDAGEGRTRVLRAADLARHLTEQHAQTDADGPQTDSVDLMKIPGLRLDTTPIHSRATLHEALRALEKSNAEAVLVQRQSAPLIAPAVGVLTKSAIESYYHIKS